MKKVLLRTISVLTIAIVCFATLSINAMPSAISVLNDGILNHKPVKDATYINNRADNFKSISGKSSGVVRKLVSAASIAQFGCANGTQSFTTPGKDQFIVPAGVTKITITAVGAAGGNFSSDGANTIANLGGKGAQVKGSFTVTPGDVLNIFVGQKGQDNFDLNDLNSYSQLSAGGGGGGSFVTKLFTDTYPLAAAGGGGGAGYPGVGDQSLKEANIPNVNGAEIDYGNDGIGSPNQLDTWAANGDHGYNGSAGTAGAPSGSGASWLENGAQDLLSTSFLYGYTLNTGGISPTSANALTQPDYSLGGQGGIGGGGSSAIGGGGGGGYSGGGGGGYFGDFSGSGLSYGLNGGGGGSYLGAMATNVDNKTQVGSGDGYVIIEYGEPITSLKTTFCVGETVIFGDNCLDGGTWSISDPSIAKLDLPSAPVGMTGVVGVSAGTTTLKYSYANGAERTISITIVGLPTVASITGNTSVLVGGTSNLSNATGNGIWSTSNSAVASLDGSNGGVVSGVSAGVATISYTVTNATGCITKVTKDVTVTSGASPLVVGSIGVPQTICSGSTPNAFTSTTNASGGTGSITYQWQSSTDNSSFTDISGATSATYAPGSLAATTYYRRGAKTATDAIQYTTPSVQITVNNKPNVTAGTNSPVCAGSTLSLTATAGLSSYSWTGPNSFTSSVQNPTVSNSATVAMAGTYSVTVTDGNGCTNTTSTSVTVNAKPTISISPASASITSGGGVSLFAIGGSTYSWSPSLGLSATTGSSVVASPTGTTVYTVTGTDANNCVNTAATNITVTKPAITITGNTNLIPNGDVTYTAADNTDMGSTTTGSPINKIFSINSVGSAPLIVTSILGSGPDGAKFGINGAPTFPATITTGNSNTFTVTFFSNSAGTYYLTVTVASNDPAIPNYVYNVKATAIAPLTPGTIGSPQTICSGTTPAALTSSSDASGGTGTISYQWQSSTDGVNFTNISGATSSTYAPGSLTATTYYRRSAFTANNAIVNSNVVAVTVNPLPTVTAGSNSLVCAGSSLTLSSTSGMSSYSWSGPNSFTSSAQNPTVSSSATAAMGGTYSVTVTDANGCTNTASTVVTVNAKPTVAISPATVSIVTGNSTTLTASGAVSYTWTPSTGLTPKTGATVTANPTTTTTYTVTGTGGNGCKNTATATVTVTTPLVPATALNFDGVDDYVSINNTLGNVGTGDFTIEMSVRTPSANAYFFSKRAICGDDNFISMQSVNGRLSIEIDGGSGDYHSITGNAFITDNNWHHIALTRKAGIAYIYVDGILDGTVSAPSNINNNYVTTLGYSVCTGQNISVFFQGDMDEVRVWSRALCASELNADKGCGLNATGQTGLVALYHLDQGNINADNTLINFATDATGNNNGTLVNFTLNGATSNWAAGIISGTCAAFTAPTAPITGSTNVCVSSTTTLSNANAGTWSSSNNAVATVSASGVVSGVAAGSATITFTNDCGGVSTASVTVSSAPAYTTTVTDVLCNGQANGTITVTPTSGTSPFSYSLDFGSSYQASNIFTGLAAGAFGLKVKDASGCATPTAATFVNQPAVLNISASVNDLLCNGSAQGSVSFTVTGGTAPYSYSKDGINFQASQNFNNLSAGTYTFVIKDANGCTSNSTQTVSQPSVLTLTPSVTPVSCAGGNNGSISIIGTGGTAPYTYYVSGFPNFQSGNTFTGLTAGTYNNVVIKDVRGCSVTQSVTVGANALPTISGVSGSTDICARRSTSLTASSSAPSPLFNWYDANNVLLYTGNTLFTGNLFVTTTYYVEVVSNGCTSVKTPVTVNVNPMPPQPIISQTENCDGTTTLTITNPDPGATVMFANTAVIPLTPIVANSIVVTGPAVYLSIQNGANGCQSYDVTINVAANNNTIQTPTITADGSTTFCAGGSVTLTASAGSSYLWSNGATTQAITTSVAGSYTVTVTNASGCSAVSAATVVTVTPNVTPTFTQVAAICSGTTLSALPTTSTNGISGTWSPALNNTATTTYTFTPSAGQCATTATMTITVNANVTPTFTQVAAICSGATLSALPTTSNNGITGTWSPALNNTATTTYTFTPSAGICASTTTLTITVNPLPVVNTVSSQFVCANAATTAVNFAGTGAQYTWTNDNTSIGLAASGSGNIPSFTAVNATNSPVVSTVTVTPSSGGGSLIYGSSLGGQLYTFNSASNTQVNVINNGIQSEHVAVSPDGTKIYLANSTANTVSVYNLSNNALIATIPVGSSPSGIVISPNGAYVYVSNQQSNTISVINASTNTVTNTIVIAAAFYPYTTPLSIAISPDGNTLYTANQGGGSFGSIGIINVNTSAVSKVSLGSGPGPMDIVVSPSGDKVYVSNPNSGSVYVMNTSTNAISTINVGIGTSGVAISPDGNHLYATSYGGNKLTVSNTGTLLLESTITIGTDPYGVTVTPDGLYAYVANATSGTVSVVSTASNTVVGTISAGDNIKWMARYVSAPSSSCTGTPITYTYTVNPKNTVTLSSAVGTNSQTVCNNTSIANITYSTSSATGATFSGLPSGVTGAWIGNVVTISGTPTISGTFNYTVTLTGGCGTVTASGTITVSPNVTPTFSQVAAICSGASLSALPTTSSNGITGTWSPALNNNATTTYTFTPSAGQCATTATMIITVNAAPIATITAGGPTTFCAGGSVTLTASAGSSYAWSNGATTQAITTSVAGSYNLTVTNALGCSASSSSTKIIVSPTPTLNAISNQVVCVNSLVTAINFSGTGTSYSWTNSDPTIGLSASGTGNIPSFTAINNGNTPLTANVTVTPISSPVGFAYIPNYSSSTVSVINIGTYAVVTTISGFNGPFGVTISNDGTKVYVPNRDNNTVSVISTTSNTITATLPTSGIRPSGVMLSKDGAKLYVTNENSNTVDVFNTSTNALISTITVGRGPRTLAISPDGSKVYTFNMNGNSVSVINTSTDAVITSISVGNTPTGGSISPDGTQLLVANSQSYYATLINTSTNTLIQNITLGFYAHYATFSPDGTKAYVGNYGTAGGSGNTVSVINTTGYTISSSITVGSNPVGLALTSDGSKLFVANPGSNQISVINTSTNATLATIGVGSTPNVYGGNFIFNGSGTTCSGTPVNFGITVNPKPTATITAIGSTSVCPGSTVTLNANTGSGYTYQWYNNGSLINGATASSYGATASGSYTVIITSNGCVSAASNAVAVTVQDLVPPVIPTLNPIVAECSATAPIPNATDACTGNVAGVPSGPISFNTQGDHIIHWTFTDGNGNAVSADQHVIIKDVTPPVPICPGNISVISNTTDGHGNPGANVIYPTDATATDNCGVPTISYSIPSGSFFPYGTTTVTVTADDGNGNTATCTFDVTVTCVPPVITSPVIIDQVISTTVGRCDAPATYTFTASGIPAANLSYTFTGATTGSGSGTGSGSIFNKGVTNVTVNAINSCGTVSSSFTITVVDNEVPSITAPADITQNVDPNSCTTTVALGSPIYADNCPGVTVSRVPAGNVFTSGVNTVTWTATDAAGHTTSALQTVTIIDNIAPVIVSCPGTITVNAEAGKCSAVVSFNLPPQAPVVDRDYHDIHIGTTGQDQWQSFTSGKSGLLTQIDLYRNGIQTNAGTISVYSGDGIGGTQIYSGSYNFPNGNNWTSYNLPVGSQPTLTAGQTYTIRVQNPGGLSNQGIYLLAGSANLNPGNYYSSSYGLNPVYQGVGWRMDFRTYVSTPSPSISATDNCGVQSFTSDHQSGDVFTVGTTHVTYTAVDFAGNKSTCSFDVVVKDAEPPVLVGVPADATVPCNAVPAAAVVTATDNCSGNPAVVFSEVITNQSNPGNYQIKRTWTTADAAGNITAQTQTITVVDNVAPVITCPTVASVIANTIEGGIGGAHVDFTATATDNCGLAPVVYSNAPNSFFPIGTTTVTVTSDDGNGNISHCSFDVTVTCVSPLFTQAPVNQTINTIAGRCDAQATYTAAASGIPAANLSYTFSGATTGSGTGSGSGSIFNKGVTTVTITATNICGTVTSNFTVTVEDHEFPLIVNLPGNINKSNDVSACGAMITWPTVSATDNCSVQSFTSDHQSGETFATGTTTVHYTATDASGNVTTGSFTVTVTDNESPVLTAVPSDISVECDAVPVQATVTSNDNCSVASTLAYQFPSNGIRSLLTHKYNFENNFTDGKGTANGTAVGAVGFAPGIIGTAASFNGSGSYVNLGTAASISGTVNFAISVWVKTSSSAQQTIVQQRDGAFQGQYILNISSNHNGSVYVPGVVYFMTYNTNFQFEIYSSVRVDDGKWHHIVAEREGTAGRIFIDGILSGSGNGPIQSLTPSIGTYVGKDVRDGNKSFNGLIDELKIIAGASCANTYDLERTWSAKDASGNQTAAQQIVSVKDTKAPVITLPSNLVLSADQGQCSTAATYTASAVDNCSSNVTISYSIPSGSRFNVGTTTVTVTAEDACGNKATGNFTVTVTDDEKPTVTCPSDVSVVATTTIAGVNGAYATYGTAVTGDNCGVQSTVYSQASGTFFPLGDNLVTVTVTDIHNNVQTCTFHVIVTCVSPLFTLSAINQTINTTAGRCDAPANYTATASGIPTANLSYTFRGATTGSGTGTGSGSIFNKGVTTVTITATNICGSISTSFNVTVEDHEFPVIVNLPANISQSNDAGNCGALVTWAAVTAKDNCPDVALVTDHNSGEVYPVGTTTVHYTATDASGNTTPGSFTVTVTDDEKPVITVPADITHTADAGKCSFTFASGNTIVQSPNGSNTPGSGPSATPPSNSAVYLGTASGTDNCGNVLITGVRDDNATLDAPYKVGTTIITWTATDDHGHSVNNIQTITITDDEYPTIIAPADITVKADYGSCSTAIANVTLGNPTVGDNCAIGMIYNDAQDHFNIGTTTVTWTVTDIHGHATSATQTVTVIDDQLPTIICPRPITVSCASAVPAANIALVGASDNCSVSVSFEGDVFSNVIAPNKYTITRTYKATDASGNFVTCTQLITVNDNIAPVLVGRLPGGNVGECKTSIPPAPSESSIAALYSDNCSGVITATLINTNTIGSDATGWLTKYDYTVSDVSGNTTSASVTYTAKDLTAPIVNCPSAINVSATNIVGGISGAYVTYTATATDNCGSASVSYNIAPGAFFPVGSTTVNVIATDLAGNKSYCSFTVTVVCVNPVLTMTSTPTSNTFTGGVSTSLYLGYGAKSTTLKVATNAVGSYSYNWSGTGASMLSSSTISNPVFTPTKAGSYLFTVVVTNTVTGCSSTGYISICVTDIRVPVFVKDNSDDKQTMCDHSSHDSSDCPHKGHNHTCDHKSHSKYDCAHRDTNDKDDDDEKDCDHQAHAAKDCPHVGHNHKACDHKAHAAKDCDHDKSNSGDDQKVCDHKAHDASNCSHDGHNHAACNHKAHSASDCPHNGGHADDKVGDDHQEGDDDHKVFLCHVPPGNPGKTITLSIDVEAVAAHLANHPGDKLGSCDQAPCSGYTDNVKPIIECPGNKTVNYGASTLPEKIGAAEATDNSGAVDIIYNDVITKGMNANLASYYNYTITRTWRATDPSSNYSECVQVITVQDVTKPVISCPGNITVSCSGSTTTATTGTATASDNSGGPVTITISGEVNGSGYISRTWKATDVSGNYATCTQIISIVDNVKPVISDVPDITVNCGASTLPAATGTATATDNCSNASVTYSDVTSGNVITRTWKATDASGNYSTSIQLITIGSSFSVNVTSVPTSSTYTGGVSTNLYLGFGAQSTTLQIGALPTAGAPYTYAWSGSYLNLLNSSSTAAPVFTPTTFGYYTYSVIVTNKYGCKSTATISICVTDVRVPNCNGSKVYVSHTPSVKNAKTQTVEVLISQVSSHIGSNTCGGTGNDRLGSIDQSPCNTTTNTSVTVNNSGTAKDGETIVATSDEDLKVTAMPNPSTTFFTLKIESRFQTPVELRVMDGRGRVVDAKSKIGANSTIQIGHNYSSGTYYAELIQGTQRKVVQLIKGRG